MTAKLLEKHITDTIREWQVKIGYEGGTMKLYYPAESLRRSLSLDETEDLDAALAAFCKEVQPRLGTLAISAVKDRYCMEIPEEGCSYIERKIPIPELLQNLLQVITTPGNTMEQVRNCFSSYDPEKHVTAEQIQEIVQAAIQAPSWKNSQTTRYYALVTPEKVEEFSAKCLPEFNQKSSKGAALVVTTFVKDRSGFTQDGTPDNEVGNGWGYYDLGLHDENLILRARELGLDTLIMGIRDEKAIREALSIPENELLGAVIAVGYRAINPDKPKRKTVDDILKLF